MNLVGRVFGRSSSKKLGSDQRDPQTDLAPGANIKIHGRINDGRYYAPVWGLSCEIPDLWTQGVTVSDEVSRTGEELLDVSFADDLGNVYWINGWKTPGLPAPSQHDFEGRINETSFALWRRDLSRVFDDYECVWQELLPDATLFAVLTIPGGSNLVKSDTGVRLSSTRGYLVTRRMDIVLIIGSQQNIVESGSGETAVYADGSVTRITVPDPPKSDPWYALREKCLRFAKTILVSAREP